MTTDDARVEGFLIDTPETARGWVLSLVASVKSARVAIDLAIDAPTQRRLERVWLVRHGSALGSVTALYRCGLLDEPLYSEMRAVVLATLSPTIVGAP